MALLIAVGLDWIWRKDSIACTPHEIDSIFNKTPAVADATIAWIESA